MHSKYMSVASQDVYLNLTTPISVIGSGGGSLPATASFSTITLAPPNTYIEGLILDNTAGGNDGAQILFKRGTGDADLTMYYNFAADGVTIQSYSAGNTLPLLGATLKIAALVTVSTINAVPALTLAQYQYVSSMTPP